MVFQSVKTFFCRVASAIVLCVFFASPGVSKSTVSDARLGTHPGITRLVLDVDQIVPYKIFTLSAPYRVVIDFPALKWSVPKTDGRREVGVVNSYRYGLFQAGISRLVIDVKEPVAVAQHKFLPINSFGKHRFLIDLKIVNKQAYRASKKSFQSPGWLKLINPAGVRRGPLPSAKTPKPKPRRSKNRMRVVMLDPGHGGPDPGAIGVSGLREKVVTMRAAKEVRRLLKSTGRYRVFLTRNKDTYVPLRRRYQMAEKVRAELFISIHADSHKNRRIRGASVYTLSEKSSDREAAALAARENRSDIIAGVDLSRQSDTVASILIGLRQRQTMNESAIFGEVLIDELARDIRVLRNTHRFAGFAVLKSPDTPSVLMELGYLSSVADERMFRTKSFYKKLAKSIYRSVERYFQRKTALNRS